MNHGRTHFSHQSCSFLRQRHFDAREHFVHKFGFSDVGKFFKRDSSVDVVSNVAGKLFVLKALQWPEAEVTGVEDKEVHEGSLWILSDRMVFVFGEFFIGEFLGELLYFV